MGAKGKFAVTLGLGLLLLILVVIACQPEQAKIQPMGVTNLSSLHLSDNNATATPVLMANQDGTGRIIELQDASTPVFAINDGGSMDFPGSLSSSTGAITLTDNVDVTGTLDVDGAVTLNSTLDVDGNITSGTGAVTVTDNVAITGTLDVDGAATLNSTLDVDGNISSGTGAITVTDNASITGTLDIDGAATLNSTLDVDGNISSGTGAITITDAAYITSTIDGLADIDVGTWLNLSVQTTLAITEGDTITATGTYQVITSTGACTTSTSTAIANGSETGDLLILRNGNAADAIVVDGTGANVECKANVSLGASDTLTLIWNGSDWNCVSNYDNS